MQENDRQVEEWVHYLSQMKRSRGKQHLDLPSVGDRSKVQHQACFLLNQFVFLTLILPAFDNVTLVTEKRTA